MVTIFLDTEFTSIDAPRLISIGLVSSSGREFYAELIDSWNLGECSLFVLGQVLPLLDEGGAGMVLQERLGDLYHVIRWLTAEDLEARKKMMADPEVQQALVKEHRWALEYTGLQDLPAAAAPRIAEALDGLEVSELIQGTAGRKRLETAKELAAWLTELPGPVRIIADSPLDHQLIQKLLRASGAFPKGLFFGLLQDLGYQVNNAAREAFFSVSGRRHHALDDARALSVSI